MGNTDIRHAVRSAALAVAVLIFCTPPAVADYEAGEQAWKAGRPAEALEQWRAAADAGDRQAMLALGRLYLKGLGARRTTCWPTCGSILRPAGARWRR